MDDSNKSQEFPKYSQTKVSGKFLVCQNPDIIKQNKLARRLMVGELAAKQAAEANENIKAVEADFYLKKMGYDNANAQEYLGFTSDILKKIAQTNLK